MLVKYRFSVVILTGLVLFSSFHTRKKTSSDVHFVAAPINKAESKPESSFSETVDYIIGVGKTLTGKPYRFKLQDGRILDCSGFISYIFAQKDFQLPRSAGSIATKTSRISIKEVQKGDLLFFKGRNIGSNAIGHVSIITAVRGDQIEMMHSCNRGIIVENYNKNKYYTQRLLYAGRLPQFESLGNEVSSAEVSDVDPIRQADAKAGKNTDSIPQRVKIIGVGDIMLGTNYPSSSYLPPNDGKDLLTPVRDIIMRGDISFGNLEGVFLTNEGPVKKCQNPAQCYAFKMPDHYVDHVAEAGFDMLSVANNHVNDFGDVGVKNTVRVLNEAGIHYAGLKGFSSTTFSKNGLEFGLAAFAPNPGTISINDYANARKIISHLDSICDIVIVSFHGGAEGASQRHVTHQTEFFLGENRGNPSEFSRMAIDAGADIVFGHGPHVTRAIDLYKDRFIAYSLGNFATYGRFNLSGPNGIAPIVEVDVDKEGTFMEARIHSTKQPGEGGPVLDDNKMALKEIIALTREDAKNKDLTIDMEGIVRKTKPNKQLTDN